MASPIFNDDRALNALLYVANQVEDSNIHKLFKILYFADMSHLCKYGRAITGDRYVAMKYGPVPSTLYDYVKIVRGDSTFQKDELKAFFSIHDKFFLTPLRNADTDYLSESDMQELTESIKKCKDKSFEEITQLSHGSAWEKTWENKINDEISVEDILLECQADEDYINYVIENIAAHKELSK